MTTSPTASTPSLSTLRPSDLEHLSDADLQSFAEANPVPTVPPPGPAQPPAIRALKDLPADMEQWSDAELESVANSHPTPAPTQPRTLPADMNQWSDDELESVANAPMQQPHSTVLDGLTQADMEKMPTEKLQALVDRYDADEKFLPQLANGRDPFASDNPTPDDLQYALWIRDTGKLTSDKGPGFWKTVGDLGSTVLAGVPELASQAYAYRKAKLFGTDAEKQDAENRDTALMAETANQAVGVYTALGAGAKRIGFHAVTSVIKKLGNYQSDPAFVANVQKEDDLSWFQLHRSLSVVAAQQAQVHNAATDLAVHSGWSPSGLDNAATAGFVAADPGQLAFAGAERGAALVAREFLSSAPKVALGVADGVRAEVVASAKQVTAAQQTVARLGALRSEEGVAMLDSAQEELGKMQAAHSAKADALASLDQANMAAINAAGRPNIASRALGSSAAAVGGAVESVGEKLGALDVKVVDSVLSALDAPEKGPVSAFVKRAAPSAVVGSAIGYGVSDDPEHGIVAGGIAGLGAPAALTYAGRLTRILGENWVIGSSTIPFWRRAATDAEATSLDKFIFRSFDRFQLAADATKQAAKVVGKTAATGAAFGYVASGGDSSDLSSGAGAAVAGHFAPWAFASSLHGFFEPVKSPSSFFEQKAADLRLLKDRWDNSENLPRLNSLFPSQQLEVGSVVATNPDFTLRLIGQDDASIKTDLLANGKLPEDISGVAGIHYTDPATGRSVIVLNPGHPDAMGPILGHELTHRMQSSGLAPSIVSQLIGDPELGIPGEFTKLDVNGEPVKRSDGSFDTTEDFSNAKNEYIRRLGRLGVDATAMSDADFSLEHAAESGADYLTSSKAVSDRSPTIAALVGETFSSALRDTLGAIGVPMQKDQAVKGTMEYGLRNSPAVEKLIRDYTKRWSLGLNRSVVPEEKMPQVKLEKEQILRHPQVLEMFKGSSSLNVDPKTGEIAGTRIDEKTGKRVIVDVAKVFKSAADVAKQQADLSQHIIDAVKKANDVAGDKDAVKVTTEKGAEVASGRYLSEETLASLEASGKFNPHQLATMRNVSALIKAETGDYLRFFYQPALRGSSSRYQGLSGHWRQEVPYGFFISKADNVLFRTIAPDKFVSNVENLWTKEHERASALWSNQVSMAADGWKYLTNLSEGKPGAEGLSVEKRNLLNLALGFKSADKADVNPLFDSDSHKKIDSVIVSRRIDRTNRVTAPEAKNPLKWNNGAYRRGVMNLTAGTEPAEPVNPAATGPEGPPSSDSLNEGGKATDAAGGAAEAPAAESRPPSAKETEDAPLRISTRVPTAKAATEDPLASQLSITAKDVVPDAEARKEVAATIKKYPNLPADLKKPDEILKAFHDHVVSNLLHLHDQFDPVLRERAKLWYDGARKLSELWSEKYDIPREGVAGVLASLSPQKDWFMNVDLARRVIEHRAELKNKSVSDGMVDWFRGKFADKKPDLLASLETKVGTPFSDLGLLERAVMLRAYDETTKDRGYQIITPEGDFSGPARNADGKPSKVAWGDFGTIAKALSIADNPTRENISRQLGEEHKVRNFANNILLPNMKEHGDVTIDTHAVAAALLRPLSGSSEEVGHNFGSGAPSSSVTGASGLYGLYADAYREAAAQRGRLPREMQSITWEAVRGLFAPEFKTAKNQAAVDLIWKHYKSGTLTLDDARKQIFDLAGGISAPSWSRRSN